MVFEGKLRGIMRKGSRTLHIDRLSIIHLKVLIEGEVTAILVALG
jgi:hypothetical protein